MLRLFGACCSALFCACAFGQPTFYEITPHAPYVNSHAAGVSSDGRYVAAEYWGSSPITHLPIRWSTTGVEELAPGGYATRARVISPSGNAVLGSNSLSRGYRWFSSTSGIEIPVGVLYSMPMACSTQGSIVFGGGQPAPYRWTSSTFDWLPVLPGTTQSYIGGASYDGTIAMGSCRIGIVHHPVRWTSGTATEIPWPIAGDGAYVTACSRDATDFVGVGFVGSSPIGYRYTSTEGYTPIELPAGGSRVEPLSVTANGQIVVGMGEFNETHANSQPVIWTPAIGAVRLVPYAKALGVTALSLVNGPEVSGISGDGSTIIGAQQTYGRGWVIKGLPTNPGVICGQGVFQNYYPSTKPQLDISLYQADVLLAQYQISPDKAGGFVIATPHRGDMDVVVKGPHWLSHRSHINMVDEGVGRLVFPLRNGDVDGNNQVDIGDYSFFAAAYGSGLGDPNWLAAADLNGDEFVDIADYSILSESYGEEGG